MPWLAIPYDDTRKNILPMEMEVGGNVYNILIFILTHSVTYSFIHTYTYIYYVYMLIVHACTHTHIHTKREGRYA